MDLAKINTEIVMLAEDVPLETLVEYHGKCEVARKLAKEVSDLCESRIVERIEASGPFEMGGWLFTIKTPPVTKCKNTKAALEAVSMHIGGDWDLMCEHLVSQPLKHGQCKKTLPPEVFELHFEVTREPELDVSEATPARLRKVNLLFL